MLYHHMKNSLIEEEVGRGLDAGTGGITDIGEEAFVMATLSPIGNLLRFPPERVGGSGRLPIGSRAYPAERWETNFHMYISRRHKIHSLFIKYHSLSESHNHAPQFRED